MSELHQNFDVLLICATSDEFDGLRTEIDFALRDGLHFMRWENVGQAYRGELQLGVNEHVSVGVFVQSDIGSTENAILTSSLIAKYSPKLIVLFGICAGMRSVTTIGDLIIATEAYSMDAGKVEPEGFKPEGLTYRPFGLRRPIAFVKSRKDWINGAKVHYMPVATAASVRKDNPFGELQTRVRKTGCLEMEAASFFQVLHNHPEIEAMFVKSVVDFADEFKSDDFRERCCRNAGQFCRIFLQEFCDTEWLHFHGRDNKSKSQVNKADVSNNELSISTDDWFK